MLTATTMRMQHVSLVLVLALCWACSRAAAEDRKPAAGLALGTEAQLAVAAEGDNVDNESDMEQGQLDSSAKLHEEPIEQKTVSTDCRDPKKTLEGECATTGSLREISLIAKGDRGAESGVDSGRLEGGSKESLTPSGDGTVRVNGNNPTEGQSDGFGSSDTTGQTAKTENKEECPEKKPPGKILSSGCRDRVTKDDLRQQKMEYVLEKSKHDVGNQDTTSIDSAPGLTGSTTIKGSGGSGLKTLLTKAVSNIAIENEPVTSRVAGPTSLPENNLPRGNLGEAGRETPSPKSLSAVESNAQSAPTVEADTKDDSSFAETETPSQDAAFTTEDRKKPTIGEILATAPKPLIAEVSPKKDVDAGAMIAAVSAAPLLLGAIAHIAML
ncbi:hypothetical protein DQ04_09141030 [Trypanosoma grayi]|uniref:hypothetical protein n=1 Tax=Trypanosoma grayi TaxID=71804 RepID=UPI0004F491AF|nr:hypothetical protein DQ04_09141030 [Trypanosoma grayi]KEG07669.1 hypothetical protein DQ04_09141030 [Trypanosoma grayi]